MAPWWGVQGPGPGIKAGTLVGGGGGWLSDAPLSHVLPFPSLSPS